MGQLIAKQLFDKFRDDINKVGAMEEYKYKEVTDPNGTVQRIWLGPNETLIMAYHAGRRK